MSEATHRKGFFLTILGKIGVPIIAATTVGCLLSESFEPMHIVLFAAGIAIEFASWRFGRMIRTPLLVACLSLLGACAPAPKPQMGLMYSRAAQTGELDRNPVIVIPGVLGSRLVDVPTDRVVWGAFNGDYADPGTPDGARLVALPMTPGTDLADLRDQVEPTGVLDNVHLSLFGLPISLSAYRNILTSLGVGGYRDQSLGASGAVDYGDDHFTCFQFAYDWRRDNVENAKRLHRYIEARAAYVRAELETRGIAPPETIKFDLVAHSMGGLLSRWYLRYGDADLPEDGTLPPLTWAGAERVERLIMVGTPNAGSADAIGNLVDGVSFAPILPTYPAAVLGTMPAIYQLLPRERHAPIVDHAGAPVAGLYDVAAWERRGWGLADPDADRVLKSLLPDVADAPARRVIALDHLARCLDRAERFNAALDVAADPPPGLELHLFAGDAMMTTAVLEIAADGELSVREKYPGDGTVARTSALMDERLDGRWQPRLRTPIGWTSVSFLFSDHLGMTKDPMFTDNVLYLLLEAPVLSAP